MRMEILREKNTAYFEDELLFPFVRIWACRSIISLKGQVNFMCGGPPFPGPEPYIQKNHLTCKKKFNSKRIKNLVS
jgi:hypothetical protein